MFYTHKSNQDKDLGILSRLVKQAVLVILLLVCAFGCQKEDDTSVPLSITSTNIADGATEVDVFTEISVLFSEEVDVASVNENSFVVNKGQYPIYGKVSCTGKTAVFKPSQKLVDNKEYNCTITAEVKGLNGQSIAQDYHWSFSSGVEPDLIAPEIKECMPLDKEVMVFADSQISVDFTEEIDPESINSTSFVVKNGETEVSGKLTYADKTVSFTPDAALMSNTIYTCIVTSQVKDLAGNQLANNLEWSFTTVSDIIGFTEIIQPIFVVQNCISCHNTSRDPNLKDDAFNSLTNGQFVDVNNPEGSRIVEMLNGEYHNAFTSKKQKRLILEWIKQGAKDN